MRISCEFFEKNPEKFAAKNQISYFSDKFILILISQIAQNINGTIALPVAASLYHNS